MKRIALTGQIITLILFLTRGFFISPADATTPTVVINELMWMGSSVSSADEWIELHNLTDQPIDLTGWRLTKLSNGQETAMLSIPGEKSIAPSGHFLISNYSAESAQSSLTVQPDVINTAMALANTSLQIRLYSSSNELIDTADDGAGQPLAGAYVSGSVWKSMERNGVPGDGRLADSWHTSTDSQNFDAGQPDYGTPGQANSEPNHPPVAEAGDNITGFVDESVNFDGSGSFDPDGNEITYQWDFGDGGTANEPLTTRVYSEPGDYTVSLIVSDGECEATDSLSVTIEDPAAPPGSPPGTEPIEDVEYSRDLRLNELLPNPKGLDADLEFIELTNVGPDEINLVDWEVRDSSRGYIIQAEDFPATSLKPGAYFVLPRTITGLALNNASDETVQLRQPNGTILDEIAYQPPIPEGQSYNRTKSGWTWSASVTKGKVNVISSASTTPPPDNGGNKEEPATTDISDDENPVYEYSARILLTELLPNPDGDEAEAEFIELGNFDSKEVNLLGWQISDQKTYYQFEQPTILEPGEYLALYRTDTRIALNNPGDAVFLIDPKKKIISGVSYEKASAGAAWARLGESNDWRWSSEATPNELNALVEVPSKEGDETTSAAKSKNTTLEAIVTAPNDIFGVRTAYLQAGPDGILLTLTKGDLPVLSVGDRVSVTGARHATATENKISVSTAADVTVLGPGEAPIPEQISGPDLTERYLGRLISITGTVVSKSGQNLLINNGDVDVSVYLKRPAKLSLTGLTEGNTVTITGIVTADGAGGFRILPRFQTDIATVPSSDPTVQDDATNNSARVGASSDVALGKNNKPSNTIWYGLGLTVAGSAIFALYRRQKRSREGA